jgi:chromosome segregation ATPase
MPKAVSCKLDGERLDYLESMADREGWDRSRVIRESLDVTQELGFDIEADVDDEVANRIADLERELAEKEQEIEHLETRIEGLQEHNTQLKRMVGEARIREEGFEELVEAIQQRDDDLEATLSEFHHRMGKHDENLKKSIEKMDDWSSTMRKLNQIVGEMANKVDSIRADSYYISERVEELEKREQATLRDVLRGKVTFREWLR